MILNRSFRLVAQLVFALSAVCFTANFASAQAGGAAYKGSFTLPFEARWGHVVLPPGNYSFTVDHAMVGGVVRISRGNTDSIFVLSQGGSDQQTFERSELILVRSGGSYTIRALLLADAGLILEYSVPKPEGQLLVQVTQPQLLQRIPVMMNGK
jgi:hypothetical protein